MVSTDLQTHMVSLNEIVPYAGNAKEHPEWQVDQLVSSIEKFGNCDPIAVWHNQRGQLEVVEGHGRLMALEKLGYEEAPVIFLDHLTDEQRRAYTLVHNKLTMNTDFDGPVLALELMNISMDMSEFGFETESDEDKAAKSAGRDYPLADMDIKAFEHHDYLVFVFSNELDWVNVLNKFDVKRLDYGYNGTKKVGLGRVIDGQRLIEKLGHQGSDSEPRQERHDNDGQDDPELGGDSRS